jgi:hypothetical protein
MSQLRLAVVVIVGLLVSLGIYGLDLPAIAVE